MSLALLINKDTIRKSLLILFFLTLPNSIAIHNIVLGLIIIYWFLFENKKETLKLIIKNPVVFSIYIFFVLFFLSIFWTDNFSWAIVILTKEIVLLSVPIIMSIVRENEKELLIKIFVLSMTFSEIISYMVHFKIIPPIFKTTVYDPTPFMSHISYNVLLAFCIYILIFFLFTLKENKLFKFISIIFIITMTINLFITGGRAGQVGFFVLFTLAIFQFFKINIKSFILVLIILPLIFISAYNFSKIFKTRINAAITDIKNIKHNPNSSVGLRIIFAKNSIELIKNHPFGVGVGDFPTEYEKINKKNTPNAKSTVQPHNMYLFVWASSGIIAFLGLLGIFILQIIVAFKIKDKYQPLRIAFPILFIVIMFSDSYLLVYQTTQLFIAFSALLYKEASWNLIFKGNK